MLAEVSKITKADTIKDDDILTVYKMVMKSTDRSKKTQFGDVKLAITLESESKEAIAQFCRMDIGESKNISFENINNTLDQYDDDEKTD